MGKSGAPDGGRVLRHRRDREPENRGQRQVLPVLGDEGVPMVEHLDETEHREQRDHEDAAPENDDAADDASRHR